MERYFPISNRSVRCVALEGTLKIFILKFIDTKLYRLTRKWTFKRLS